MFLIHIFSFYLSFSDSWADPNLLFGPYNWNPAEGERQYCSWDTPTNKVCNGHFFEQGLIHLVQAAEAEIYPSIGGWSLSDPFPAMAANADARLNFANKCIELIEEYGFDGIDIDWEVSFFPRKTSFDITQHSKTDDNSHRMIILLFCEIDDCLLIQYPGYADHSGTPEDTVSYNQLLSVLRLKLDELGHKNGRFYGLTAALPCGTNNINNIDIETAAKYLTEFNLMTYDFFGFWVSNF